MANNIYVGGFPYKTTKEELAKLFSACGTVLSAKVILDRETGRPKGFGFVEMSTDAEATSAVTKLNGAFIGDRKIFVVEGRPQKDRPQGPAPKPGLATKPAAKPGFVERRSGKDRRQQAGAPAPGDRREAPTVEAKWKKKPFDAAKKPWEKKPFDAPKKPWEKRPFDAQTKPWSKKPFARKPPARGPKWTPKKG
jgi:RNA recognition motif-containing protein